MFCEKKFLVCRTFVPTNLYSSCDASFIFQAPLLPGKEDLRQVRSDGGPKYQRVGRL